MQKVLVILISKDPLKTRSFEDQMANVLAQKGVGTEVGYRLIPADEHMSEEFVRSCIIDSKADAVLVSNIVAVKKETNSVPGYVFPDFERNSRFSRYYSRSYYDWHYVEPTTVEVENIFIDTRLYRCDTEGLIWELRTKITNAKPFSEVVQRLGDIVADDLRKRDLL